MVGPKVSIMHRFQSLFTFQIYYDPSKPYNVTSNDFNDTIMTVDTLNNETNFTVTNLIPDTNYDVYLSAFTGAGEGNFSDSITNMTSILLVVYSVETSKWYQYSMVFCQPQSHSNIL